MNKIAVENFLGSMDKSLSPADNLINLSIDARVYRWNAATVLAIRKGIVKMQTKKKGS